MEDRVTALFSLTLANMAAPFSSLSSVRSGRSDHSRLPSPSSSLLKVGGMKPEIMAANIALWHQLSGQILSPTSCEYMWQQLIVALGLGMENPN